MNGVLVAYARLQPILVTLATLSIYQGLAIKVLPEPGGSIPVGYTKLLASTSGPWASSTCSRSPGSGSCCGAPDSACGSSRSATTSRPRAPTAFRCAAVKVGAYVLAGMFAAAGGLFLAATTTAGDASCRRRRTSSPRSPRSFSAGSASSAAAAARSAPIAGAFTLTILTNVLFFARHRPALPVLLPGALPRRGSAARKRPRVSDEEAIVSQLQVVARVQGRLDAGPPAHARDLRVCASSCSSSAPSSTPASRAGEA